MFYEDFLINNIKNDNAKKSMLLSMFNGAKDKLFFWPLKSRSKLAPKP